MRARNWELFGLIPAALLITAGFAAVFIQRSNQLSTVSLVYGAVFLGLCLAAHIFIRITLPYADPFIFPLVAVLACFGLVMVYRIDGATLARQQAQWFVLGLVLFAGTVIWFRDYRKLENYRYLIVIALAGAAGAAARAALWRAGQRRLPGDPPARDHLPADRVRARSGWSSSSRSTCATTARRWSRAARSSATAIPPLKHLGPLLVLWGAAMVVLVVLHDIGSSLMFYGGLLAILYVATDRISFVLVGVLAFVGGAWYLGTHIAHIDARVAGLAAPLQPTRCTTQLGGSLQLANAQFAMAAGGLFGQGFGQTLLTVPGTHDRSTFPSRTPT